ncbi:ribosome hibernation-promoting factor, HPF/YfiA family [Salegentibacter sp.]|uniref:ribosome hibernation-promoting factor, HPF/YfiA family n=1 Tax=Salegentibacter sp. TaxID=1903072 RepID=UPI003567544B
MDARFQYVKMDKSDSLEEFSQKKLDKLEDKYDFIISADVHFKRHEVEDPKGYICNINLSVPGPKVFAESNETSLEAALVESIKDIDRQLQKRKAKMSTH